MKHSDVKLPVLRLGKEPAYQRLYSAFRDSILDGTMGSGERLSPTRELAAFYGIARNTVTQAYEQLISEGYLEGRQGSGTFVSSELPDKFLKTKNSPHSEKSRNVVPRSGEKSGSKQLKAFASGCPDLARFPREQWIKCCNKQVRKSNDSLDWYGQEPGGYYPLRESIAAYLNTHRGLACDARQILILNGSQSGIDLVARSLISKGDTVALENPCYRGMIQAFKLSGATLAPVPIDRNGMRIDLLRRRKKTAKLAVVTPSRQFPLGFSMPIGRRMELLGWASSNNSWILEDDYDSEFRFRGNPVPAMQGLDQAARTLYIGTFSRSMFPDLRIGYLVVPNSLVEDFQAIWRASGMNPPVSTQAAIGEFLKDGSYLRHVRKMRLHYGKRCERLKELIESKLDRWLEVPIADGGLHLVALFKKPIDANLIVERAMRKGIRTQALSECALSKLERDGLILGFASFDDKEVSQGIETLIGIFSELEHL